MKHAEKYSLFVLCEMFFKIKFMFEAETEKEKVAVFALFSPSSWFFFLHEGWMIISGLSVTQNIYHWLFVSIVVGFSAPL